VPREVEVDSFCFRSSTRDRGEPPLMSKLELAGLTKRFGTHAAVDALDLTVESGTLVSLLGPSGCG
jgi:ABC-type transporter Mla maintaining outer membrane lipid asymmetry ATPase subunit MlaF